MTAFRVVFGAGVLVLLAFAAGCAGDSPPSPVSSPSPGTRQPGSVVVAPTPLATVSLAPVKSVSLAKPIPTDSLKGPRLSLDAEAVDYGDVPFSQIVAFSFNVKDVGTAPVTLEPPFIRVKEGC